MKNSQAAMPAYNYSQLKARTAELGKTDKAVAMAAGMTPSTYSLKLNGKGEFTQEQIVRIMEFLDIRSADVHRYFFSL